MKENEVDSQLERNEEIRNSFKKLYGVEPEMSLLSVDFSPPENHLLNENYSVDVKENE